jgi:PIN domain nuclease of toxin-antitoxin system
MGREMNYIIDTHVALWWWADDKQLSNTVRELMADTSNEIYFSAISGYEIILKNRLGKLPLPEQLIINLADAVNDEGWKQLPLSLNDTLKAASYTVDHRDPFDRMLAAQSQINSYPLLSADKALELFPVKVCF